MLKSKKSLGIKKVVDIQLSKNCDKSYITENGIASHNCQWCDKFYTEGGKPKEYRLSELVANGSNYGKPKSAWLPTISVTHPRCRCQLHYKT